jgi:hypothetical protein
MLTTDFSGTYDYEKDEAESEADTLLADLADGYYSPDQFEAAKTKTLAHWTKVFRGEPESLAEFSKYFNERLAYGLDTISAKI